MTQKETFLKLHHIVDNPGARKKSRRVGRGIGSGRGKTAGVGGKGQHGRSGVAINGFQGGQMPITRRFPKRGFTNIHRMHFSVLNLGTVQRALDEGRLSSGQAIDAAALKKAGLVKNPQQGIRLLGGGTLTSQIHVHVAGLSASAQKMVEAAGGTCSLVEPFPLKGGEVRKNKTAALYAASSQKPSRVRGPKIGKTSAAEIQKKKGVG